SGCAVRRAPHIFAFGLCLGLAFANATRVGIAVGLACAGLTAGAALLLPPQRRLVMVSLALGLVGWTWGSARLDELDRSVLAARVGTAERARLVVTGPPRPTRFDVRVPASVAVWGGLRMHEPVLLKLPRGRAPPQGAVVELVGVLAAPGDFEKSWLRRHGVHVVVRSTTWRVVGKRGGLGGVADRVRARLARSVAVGLHGEREALLQGVVLGDDSGLSEALRARFRASGLLHLLA